MTIFPFIIFPLALVCVLFHLWSLRKVIEQTSPVKPWVPIAGLCGGLLALGISGYRIASLIG